MSFFGYMLKWSAPPKPLKLGADARSVTSKCNWLSLRLSLPCWKRHNKNRILSSEEPDFRKRLKIKILGLAGIQLSIARQYSRQTCVQLGDANTFFHLMANHRKRKNFIRSLNRGDCLLTSQEDKLQEAHRHFLEILGTRGGRNSVVRWENLGYSPFELSELDTMINDDEIRNAVMGMHSEKAPRPDGFIELFYEDCFEVIREDLSKAINDFYHHKCKSLHLVNEANIVLLP
jgi:hypothetical protein